MAPRRSVPLVPHLVGTWRAFRRPRDRVMTALTWRALVVVACAACSTHEGGTFEKELAGTKPSVWQGVITGSELAAAAGIAAMNATLTLAPDGTWTSVDDNGRAKGSIVATHGRPVELEGALETGAPVRYRLTLAGPGHAAGSVHTYFGGHSVETGINLRRLD